MRTGRLLGAGRTADVFELHDDEAASQSSGSTDFGAATGPDGPKGHIDRDEADGPTGSWVLRRYRDGWGDAAAEAEVMEYVRGHGYPVPRVRSATRTEMVLQRLSGPTMVEAFAAGRLDAARSGAVLARLLHVLHALPPRGDQAAGPTSRAHHTAPSAPHAHHVASSAPRAHHAGSPAPRILHLDLHPENVILTPHGPQVIDWSNAEEGRPGLDWAISAMILAQVAVDTADSRADMAHATLVSLLAHQPDGPSGLTDECLVEARKRRAANPTMSAREAGLIQDAEGLVRTLVGSSRT